MSTYRHVWPIEDDSLRATDLCVIALDDLDERILPQIGLTRTSFPSFELRIGELLAECDVVVGGQVAA